jgi:hypothetical protein
MCHAHRPSARAVALSATILRGQLELSELSNVERIGHPLARRFGSSR